MLGAERQSTTRIGENTWISSQYLRFLRLAAEAGWAGAISRALPLQLFEDALGVIYSARLESQRSKNPSGSLELVYSEVVISA